MPGSKIENWIGRSVVIDGHMRTVVSAEPTVDIHSIYEKRQGRLVHMSETAHYPDGTEEVLPIPPPAIVAISPADWRERAQSLLADKRDRRRRPPTAERPDVATRIAGVPGHRHTRGIEVGMQLQDEDGDGP